MKNFTHVPGGWKDERWVDAELQGRAVCPSEVQDERSGFGWPLPWYCTLPLGHGGDHLAGSDEQGVVYASWSD